MLCSYSLHLTTALLGESTVAMSNPAFTFDHIHIISQNPHDSANWYVQMFGAEIVAGRERKADLARVLPVVLWPLQALQLLQHLSPALRLLGLLTREVAADEVGLSVRVSLAIIHESLREATLQPGVFLDGLPAVSKPVAKCQLVAEPPRIGRSEMQVMSSPTRMRLAEPVHLVFPVRRVEIAELREGVEASARCVEAFNANQNV